MFQPFPIFLALYVSLKDDDPSWALLALVMGLLGLVLLVPARPIVEMFALSKLAANGADPAAVEVAKDPLKRVTTSLFSEEG